MTMYSNNAVKRIFETRCFGGGHLVNREWTPMNANMGKREIHFYHEKHETHEIWKNRSQRMNLNLNFNAKAQNR